METNFMTAARDILKDEYGLWDDIPAMTRARGDRLRALAKSAGIPVKTFSKDVGLTRTKIYQDVVPIPKELRDRLIDLTRIIDNATLLFEGDKEKALDWIMTPNRRFMNFSPFSMALVGKGKTVYEHQEYVLQED